MPVTPQISSAPSFQDFYRIEVELELLRGRADGTCDHEVYLITFPAQHTSNTDKFCKEGLEGERPSNLVAGLCPSLFYKVGINQSLN